MAAAAERRGQVVKFKPVDVGGKDVADALRDIARGVNQTHECVHAFQKAQAERDDLADTKREALASAIGTIGAKQEIDSGRITALAKAVGTERVEKGEAKPKAHMDVSLRGLLKIAGAISASLGLVVFLYKLLAALAPSFHQFMLTVAT